MAKKANIKQFPYDGTITLQGDKGSHMMDVPCLLSVKVKNPTPEAMEGTAWINSAAEPKTKAWLYCKFSARKAETGWQVQVEGADLADLIAERLDDVQE